MLKKLVAVASFVVAITSVAAAQVVQGSGLGSNLRVTVLDPTEAALVIARVTIVNSRGVEQTAAVDDRGVAVFENLSPGTHQVKATAESFRPIATPFNVRRGDNRDAHQNATSSRDSSRLSTSRASALATRTRSK